MLEIISAFYGPLDVKDILISKISNDKLNITVNNELFSDPQYGVYKFLKVEYIIDGEKNIIEIGENNNLNLPPKKMSKIEEIFKAWRLVLNHNSDQADLACKRIEICNECEFKAVTEIGNMEIYTRCSVCGCALSGKIYTPLTYKDPGGSCPKGKWENVEFQHFNSIKN